MSSTIQVYTNELEVTGNKNTGLSVTLHDVDASDFVAEFTVDEILSAMDFDSVFDWAVKNKGDNE